MVVSPIGNLVYCSPIRNITLLLATDLKLSIEQESTSQYKSVCSISKLCFCERSMASYTVVTGYLTIDRTTMSLEKHIYHIKSNLSRHALCFGPHMFKTETKHTTY